jgi:hypothetical protein
MDRIGLVCKSLMISVTVEQIISRVENLSSYVIRMFYSVRSVTWTQVLQCDPGTTKSSQSIIRLISSNSCCDVSVILWPSLTWSYTPGNSQKRRFQGNRITEERTFLPLAFDQMKGNEKQGSNQWNLNKRKKIREK